MCSGHYKIGDLIRIKIEMCFSREECIKPGDYGIVVSTDVFEGHPIPFDYMVTISGIDILVFEEEIELVEP